nr:hypothetical protein [Halanaeroarchaeum sp. HSR-CO]
MSDQRLGVERDRTGAPVTTVDLRCTGHVRRAVGFGKTEYRFEGR